MSAPVRRISKGTALSIYDLPPSLFALAAAAIGLSLLLFPPMRRRKQPRKHVVNSRSEAVTLPKIEHDDPDLRERNTITRHIAELMLQDEWTAIADQIADWEDQLVQTPGGQRFHDIAADVALSGLQELIDSCPHDSFDDMAEVETELSHFYATHRSMPDNHVLAVLAAHAQIIVGNAYRAEFWPEGERREAYRRMARHYLAAGEILESFEPLAYMSPLLAEAQYLQALGSPGGIHRLPELFEAWIELDPANPAVYAAHANYLSDAEMTSDEDILRESDAAMVRTEETLGFGGYALFFLPLLSRRENARHLMDAELFATALLDLATQSATPADANWAASALAVELDMLDNDDADTRMVLRDTLLLLIRQTLTVVYPRMWAIQEEAVRALLQEAAEALPDLEPELHKQMELPQAA